MAASQKQPERKRTRQVRGQAATQAELRLAAIVESSDDAIIGKDLDGIITDWNKGAERLYGYSADEVIGKPISLLMPPDRADDFAKIMGKMKHGERVNHFETERQRKDGTHIEVSLTVSPIIDGKGRIVGASAIAREITGRKRTEEAMREREELLRMASEGGKMFAYKWDAATDQIVRSEGVTEILGKDEGTHTTGQHVSSMTPPEDREKLTAAVARLNPEEPHLRIRYRMVRSDGTVIWVNRTSRAYFDEHGKILRIVGMLADITERVRAEEALIKERGHLIEAQRLAQLGSWEWDPHTGTVTWSRELYRIAGLDSNLPPPSYEEMPQYYTAESWERLQRSVQEALQSGTPYELDLEIVRPDATKKWVRTRGETLRDSAGRVVRLRGTGQDITERKLAHTELVLANDRLRLAMESGKSVGWDWDIRSGQDSWFGDLQTIFGMPSTNYVGSAEDFHRRIHPDDRGPVAEAVKDAMRTREPYAAEFRIVWPDGTVRWVASKGSFHYSPGGEPERMLGIAVDITERKLAEETIADMSRKLLEAQEQERARIARELHDDIGQRLALLSVELQQLKEAIPDSVPEPRNRTAVLERKTSEIAADVQSLAHELHSSKLEYLGLVAAMRGFCTEFAEKQKVDINFTQEGMPPAMPQEISICLFRVMQEALQNALKHSGVQNFEVNVNGSPTEIYLTVRDSGMGFDPELAKGTQGLGLVSMQERVRLVKGTISIVSKPQSGTEVRVCVPLSAWAQMEQAKSVGS